MEGGSKLATFVGCLAASVAWGWCMSSSVTGKVHNEVAAAIIAKHNTPASTDKIGDLIITEGATKQELLLALEADPTKSVKDIPLQLLLKALAADRVGTNSTVERPASVQ